MCPHRYAHDRDMKTVKCFMEMGEILGFIMTDVLDIGPTMLVDETLRAQENEDVDIVEELDTFYNYVVDEEGDHIETGNSADNDDDDDVAIEPLIDN